MPDRQALDALRVEYRRVLLRLAARDLAHHQGVDDVAAELSDLAAGTLEAALAVARARVGDAASTARLAVIAMGKCGGHELNYVSDVDVIFVFEPAEGADENAAAKVAGQLASHLIRICSDHTGEGTIWPVDAALRPEGKSGPLVRTLASHRGYYERWAKTWEFQALLKARPVAGDLELGREYVEIVDPMVWQVAERDGFVEDVQAMRRRVVDHIPAHEAERQLKLGSGGLRDVEFAVQLLQLVHGRADERVRPPTTLSALAELTRGGYVGRPDGEALHEAYSFLRMLEHRIQLHQLRRTHVVPEDEDALRRLGRSLGFTKEPVAELDKVWQHHRREVRRLHEKLFYRPLLAAVAKMPGSEARLTPEAARRAAGGARLRGPQGRAAAPRGAHLRRLAHRADPAHAAPGDARVVRRRARPGRGSVRVPPDQRLARRHPVVPQHPARRGPGRRAAGPVAGHLPLRHRPAGARAAGRADARRRPDAADRRGAHQRDAGDGRTPAGRRGRGCVRCAAIRRRELFRIAVGDLLGETDVADVGAGLSRLTDATLEATLDVAGRAVREQKGLDEAPTVIAIIAMGRYGGFELSYGSDADVMFVHDPVEGADPHAASTYAQAVANELRRLLALPGGDPALEVDAGLRPEGKQGPLVRTLDSYAKYYAKWSKVWEAQALLRADAVVGDEDLRRRFTELIDPLRYPADGITQDDVIEVRRIKARVDTERLPRGADPNTHLKLGRGGLADIEWTVQLLQLRHAAEHPGLRTPRTLDALAAAGEAGLLDAKDAEWLAHGWRTVSRVRNAVTLVRGKPGDHLPRDAREKAAVATVMGYPPGASAELVNDYMRHTRRTRAVVDRVFWS